MNAPIKSKWECRWNNLVYEVDKIIPDGPDNKFIRFAITEECKQRAKELGERTRKWIREYHIGDGYKSVN